MSDPLEMPPDEEKVATPFSPNQLLLYILVSFLLLIFYAIAWKSLQFVLLDSVKFLSDYKNLILAIWLIPVFGLIMSVVYPSFGATFGWQISMVVIGAIPLLLAKAYVLWFGLPPVPVEPT